MFDLDIEDRPGRISGFESSGSADDGSAVHVSLPGSEDGSQAEAISRLFVVPSSGPLFGRDAF